MNLKSELCGTMNKKWRKEKCYRMVRETETDASQPKNTY